MTRPVDEKALFQRLMTKGRLRQMQMITTVADLGNVNRAAVALGITQPAVTKSIAEFEDDLGLALFERHARGMRLTSAGKDVVVLLRRIQETARFCAEVATAHRNNKSSIVRVASVSAGISGVLAPGMAAFATEHPAITVEVIEIDGSDHGAVAQWDQHDVVVCREPADYAAGLAFDTLLEDRHVIVAPAGHALTRRRRVSLDDLLDCEWLQPPAGVPGERLLDELLGDAARYCRIRSRALPLGLSLLTQRALLALVPETIYRPMIDAGLVVKIAYPLEGALAPLGLLYPREGQGSATTTFIEFLQAWAETGRRRSALRKA